MTTYYIVMMVVVFLCIYAESKDYTGSYNVSTLEVFHTTSTNNVYFVVILVLALVSGLRYRVGADYMAYYYGYQGYIDDLPNSIRLWDEPGYGVLAWIGAHFYNNGASAIFLAALITVGLSLIIIFKHTNRVLLASFLYVTLGCWHGSFNGIRQYLAAAVLFYGFDYLRDRKLLRWIMVVFIASLFHRSVVVMVVLYFITDIKINWKNLLLVLSVTILLVFSFNRQITFANFIMGKDYNPLGGYTSHAVNRLRVMAACVPAVAFYVEYRDYDEVTKEETFYINISIFHAAIRVATMNSALLYRIGIYTTLFQVLAITELLKGVSSVNRRIITLGIVIMQYIMWWYEISGSSNLIPFQFIWNR